MSHVLTLVASDGGALLTEAHFKDISRILLLYGTDQASQIIWLNKSKAGEICISSDANAAMIQHLRDALEKDRIDFFVTKNEHRQKKLLLADMESTIIPNEMLDDLAEDFGVGDQVKTITARAMNGCGNFCDALNERVALLKGLSLGVLERKRDALVPNPGAEFFVKTMQKNDAKAILVSGGFTFFTKFIAEQCGFDFHHGNVLCVDEEQKVLAGTVEEPILSDCTKVKFLQEYSSRYGLRMEQCLCIGDGSNDLPMLKMAGLGIGYHPKDIIKREIVNCILYGDLTAALYAQGISRRYFAEEE